MLYPTEFQEIAIDEIFYSGQMTEESLLKIVANERRVIAGSTRRGSFYSQVKVFDLLPPTIPDTTYFGYEWFSFVFKGNPARVSLDVRGWINTGALVVVSKSLPSLTYLDSTVLTSGGPTSKIDIPDNEWCKIIVYGGVGANVDAFAARETFSFWM